MDAPFVSLLLWLALWLALAGVLLCWHHLLTVRNRELGDLLLRAAQHLARDAEDRATMSVRLFVRTGQHIYVCPPDRLLQEATEN